MPLDTLSTVQILGHAPTVRRSSAPRRPPLAVQVDYSLHARAIAGDIVGRRWGHMLGWETVSASTVIPPVAYTFDIGLTLSGTSVNLDAATPAIIGGITEPPADGLFLRSRAGTVYTWQPAAAGTAYVWGIGIDEGPPGTINLIPATAAELGGVTVQARSATQGLALDAAGDLAAPLATESLAGSIVEPPADDLLYVRTRTALGVSSWVPSAVGADFGLGLSLDTSTTPPIVNLQPAGHEPRFLGGIYTLGPRSDTEGLDLDPARGRLTVPRATDSLAGSIVEPPANGIAHTRQWDIAASRWVWAPAATAGLQITGLIPEQVIIPSSTPVLVHAYGSEFTATCEILLDGTPVVPPAALISSTEMTFTMDPTPETAMRSVIVTVRDTAGPVAGAGAESFVFAELVESLYRGRWQPGTNTPDIGVLVKDDQWMWIADTVDPLVGEVAPAGLPGIGGQTINEGDHIIWDATAAVFFNITGPWRDFGTGLAIDRTQSPPLVNLTPAGDGPATLGGVYVVDRVRNVSEGLELGIDGRLRAPLATDSLAGTLLEPPPDDRGYVRRRSAAGVSAWVPPADTPMPDFGIGLDHDTTTPPGVVNLLPAKFDPLNLGGVYILPASGIGISPDGGLAGVPATPTTVGVMFDAPFDTKNYVRQDGAWVEPIPAALPIAGNTVAKRGVVYVPDDRGLNLDAEGQLWLRPATSQHVGGFLEPDDPTNAKTYVRRVGGWVEAPDRVVVAGDNSGQKGIVYVPDAQGLALQQDGRLTLAPATPSQVGGMADAPFSDPADLKSYARQNAAWVEVQSERILVAGDNPAQKGIVYVPDRTGLALAQDGRLTLAPTTPSQVGGIVDAPFSDPADPKSYVRQNAAWVESSAATQKLYGVGLIESLDKTRVDLKIAGLNDEIGGVRTFARGPTNGLEFDNQTGVISVPLATDRLPGAMVEPDGAMGGQFVRTWNGTTGAWVPVTSSAVLVSDTPPVTPTPNTLWWDSDSGNLFVAYQDVDSTQWVQINTAAPPTTGIADAPNDGQPYNRQSGGWTVDTAAAATVGDVKAGFQPSDHAGWIKLDGRAVSTLTVTQQAAAATLGFTANMPDADGAVPMQSSAFGPLAQGGLAGSMDRTITLTQANLPAVDLAAESAGAHSHLFDVRQGAADKNFWGFVNDGRDAADWAADVMIARSHAAGGAVESAPKPIFRDAGAHGHVVPLGGSGTAIQLDITPKAFAANYFCYLGA